VHGFEAALQRCREFEEEGADIVFLEAPVSEQELRDFIRAMRQPTMANFAPGGKTPMLSQAVQKEIGVRLSVYHPMLFSAVRAMQDALAALHSGDAGKAPAMATFDEVKRAVGLPEHDALERRYAPSS
jgi:2-methylisocitrate lyase-like PEP mutase family enzyme